MYKVVINLRFVIVCLSMLVVIQSRAQSDSLELRKAPVLSELPIIFDRNEIAEEINDIESPVLEAKPVEVSRVEVASRLGQQTGLRLQIPEVNVGEVKRSWGRYLRREGDGKLQRDGNNMYMEDLMIKEVSADYFNAECWLDEEKDHTTITIALLSDSTIMKPDENKALYDAMENVLLERGREAYREKVEEDLQEERDRLNDLEKEMSRLVKDSEKSHKQISDNNIAINQANVEIDQNEAELDAIGQELSRYRSNVSAATDKESKKEARKQEKDAERTRKKLQRDREKLFQSIIDSKRQIQEGEQAIRKNLQEQRQLLLDMHRQTLVIEALKMKMDQI